MSDRRAATAAEAYERQAEAFLARRDTMATGRAVIAGWAASLPAGTEVIELACGGGYPVTQALVECGAELRIWALDSSATLLQRFNLRFPEVPTQCASALQSDFFGRRFDAAIAVGLIFLLTEPEQRRLLAQIAEILRPGGRLLFSAPLETGRWQDVLTGLTCQSLGRSDYLEILQHSGLDLLMTCADEGGNNYYDLRKRDAA